MKTVPFPSTIYRGEPLAGDGQGDKGVSDCANVERKCSHFLERSIHAVRRCPDKWERLIEEETRLVDTRKAACEFLGFVVAGRQGRRSQRWYPHVEPSAKSQAKLRDKVRVVLAVRTRNQAAVAVVHGLFSFFTDDRLEGPYKLWKRPLTAAWKR